MHYSKKFLRLLKQSAKKSFKMLRANGPFYCTAIDQSVKVTRVFFNHVAHTSKKTIADLVERLLIIPFIDEILEKGVLIETRKESLNTFFRIALKSDNNSYTTIIMQEEEKLLLLSCFIDKYNKKSSLS